MNPFPDRRSQELISDEAGLAFPVVDGIANLVPSAARPLVSPSAAGGTAPSDSR